MKRLIFILLITTLPCGAQDAPPKVGDKITLKSGEKAVIAKIDHLGVSVITSDGGFHEDFVDMPPDLQKAFGFDPIADAAYRKQLADAAAKAKKIRALGFDPDAPKSPKNWSQPSATNGVVINSLDTKIMERSSTYLYVAWRVGLMNKGDEALPKVFLRIYYLDNSNFRVDDTIEDIKDLRAGESRVVSGQLMIKSEDWAKVSKYTVEAD